MMTIEEQVAEGLLIEYVDKYGFKRYKRDMFKTLQHPFGQKIMNEALPKENE